MIFKYASHFDGLSRLRKSFLESDSLNAKEGGDRVFLSQLQALSCPRSPPRHFISQVQGRVCVMAKAPLSPQSIQGFNRFSLRASLRLSPNDR